MHFYLFYNKNNDNFYLIDFLNSNNKNNEFIAKFAINFLNFSIRFQKVIKYLKILFNLELKFEIHVDYLKTIFFKRFAIFNALTTFI